MILHPLTGIGRRHSLKSTVSRALAYIVGVIRTFVRAKFGLRSRAGSSPAAGTIAIIESTPNGKNFFVEQYMERMKKAKLRHIIYNLPYLHMQMMLDEALWKDEMKFASSPVDIVSERVYGESPDHAMDALRYLAMDPPKPLTRWQRIKLWFVHCVWYPIKYRFVPYPYDDEEC